ncbi:unnamed protein product [Gongylonema pulchrum]|uniref:Uncharacterized protein n=1 Tax=Gongylonema pulchrum TaxID=637853 RepID=A0A183EGA4_9BILA|nr:unnamed protein product [Gongylonema pulchrum]
MDVVLTSAESTVGDTTSTSNEKRKKKPLSKSRSTVGDDDQIEYKAGWVVRKCLFDRDGKRSNSCQHFGVLLMT